MAQHHNGAIRNDSSTTRPPHLGIIRCKQYLWYTQYVLSVNQCRNKALLTLNFMLLENAPCVECMDKGLCFLPKYRAIIATAYWILLLMPSFAIWQGQPCSHAFHELVSEEQTSNIMCETKIDPSVLPFIACVIHTTALLQVSAVFRRMCSNDRM